MSKHTPGPWLIVDRTVYALTEDGKRNRFYAAVQDPFTDFLELEANARLIAAAPELLEKLKEMVEAYQHEASQQNPALLAARVAIAKATGEAQ